jgi:hypothetical protein
MEKDKFVTHPLGENQFCPDCKSKDNRLRIKENYKEEGHCFCVWKCICGNQFIEVLSDYSEGR